MSPIWAIQRLLRFLAKGPVKTVEQANRGKLMLESEAHGAISIEEDAIKVALSQGLATLVKTRLVISDAGRAYLRRLERVDDPFAAQHRRETTIEIVEQGVSMPVRTNAAE